MGDHRRFDLFAKKIKASFGTGHVVADVAGGKGYLNLALKENGFTKVVTYDPKSRTRIGKDNHKGACFNENRGFTLLVGMHPDEATDVIIDEATKAHIPFAVCPCCIMPNRFTFWENHTFTNWVKHLRSIAIKRGYEIQDLYLPMTGKNLVLVGKPRRNYS